MKPEEIEQFEKRMDRKIIKTYGEAIEHINLTINQKDSHNIQTINLRNLDFTQFCHHGEGESHFEFNELFHCLKIFKNKGNEIICTCILDCCNSVFNSASVEFIKFEQGVFFCYTIFKKGLDVQVCLFNSNLDLQGAIFIDNLDINNCVFKSDLQLSGGFFANGLVLSMNKSLEESFILDMKKSKIYGFVNLIGNRFNNLTLNLQKAKLLDCNLQLHGKFNEVLLDEVITNETTIIKVENAIIEKFSITFSSIKAKVYFLSNRVDYFDAMNTIVEGVLFVSNKSVVRDVSGRYTAKLLKHESIKANDVITSNHFRMLELKKYQEELVKNRKSKRKLDLLNEMAILMFSWLSNKHGQSWIRGFCFTVLSSVIFYFLFGIISNQIEFRFIMNNENLLLWGLYWKEVLRYFWLPDISGLKGLEVGFWGALIFIIGKIFIAYGIYQTVAAFRKYSSSK